MSPSPPPLSRLPRFGDDDYSAPRVAERRALAEAAAGRALPHLSGTPVPSESARGKIEGMIGYAQVPVGLAGPLLVDTSAGLREVYVPMAATEGALVASYSRGMRLLRSGSAPIARVVKDGLSQHPVLVYENLAQARAAVARAH